MGEEIVKDPVPEGATHRFRAKWFKEAQHCWLQWSRESRRWLLVGPASYHLLDRQAAPITDFMREHHGSCPST